MLFSLPIVKGCMCDPLVRILNINRIKPTGSGQVLLSPNIINFLKLYSQMGKLLLSARFSA